MLDSTVVFNELMFNPPGADEDLEWIELHNQMAVDMDLSAWSIRDGIDFVFPMGTTVPGGGYLVVAKDPAALVAATGIPGALGPYDGQLSNGGERLELKNKSDRVMDTVQYEDRDPWPAGPDGSGATLAKIDPDLGSGAPKSWTASPQIGGTPGAVNFPPFDESRDTATRISVDAPWHYDALGTAPPAGWTATDFADDAWASGAALLGAGSVTIDLDGGPPPEPPAPAALPIANAGFEAPATGFGGGGNYYTDIPDWNDPIGGPAGLGSTQNHTSTWLNGLVPPEGNQVAFIQGPGSFQQTISGLEVGRRYVLSYFENQRDIAGTGTTYSETRVSLGGQEIVPVHQVFRTGTWHEVRSAPFSATTTSAVLKFENLGGSGDNSPLFDDIRIVSAAEPFSVQTDLPLGPVTYYFRREFTFDGDPTLADLTANMIVDDGAVLYLNGTEVARVNMPAGPISPTTPAATAVGDPAFSGPVVLPAETLLAGTNVLAVEVHQAAAAGDGDLVFGLELVGSVGKPDPRVTLPSLSINEVAGADDGEFFVEIVNFGDAPVDVTGYVVRASGTFDTAHVLPAQPALAPGAYLVLDQAALGFDARAGDRVFLFGPDGSTLVDAARVADRPRGRLPRGQGRWLFADVATPGTENHFDLHDEIVINEIMYHPRYEVAPMPVPPPLGALAFDFGPAGAPVASGYTRVGTDGYEDGTGYGWTSGTRGVADRGTAAPLHRDFVSVKHPSGDFAVDLANGTYYVTVLMGDTEKIRDQMQIRLEPDTPREVTDQVTVAAGGDYFRETYVVTITDGQLNLELDDLGGVTGRAVINALLVSPTPFVLDSSRGEWVELFNRGDTAVDLTGWKLDDAVGFAFTPGTSIGPGAYLVVAKDPAALAFQYPMIADSIVGGFSGTLADGGERILLEDSAGNPADEVHYYDDGYWPWPADGGGTSLELRDPRADNARAEAWAASREDSRSDWRSYSYQGIAIEPQGSNNPSVYQELVLGLLDQGEVLLDDLHVIEDPAGAAIERLQNGSFESDVPGTPAGKWRTIGNHDRSRVVVDPTDPGNHVLHLVATGPTEHMNNHAETTFADGARIGWGQKYEISFRAKWLRGSNQLTTRLYFDKMARTTRIEVPPRHGTPGAANSRLETNIGPTYTDVRHGPLVPDPDQAVTVVARADDPDGVASMTLWYAVASGAFSHVPMVRGPDGRYQATVPGQQAGATVQFYVEGRDDLGAVSTFPAAGPDSRALYRVAHGEPGREDVHLLRLIMTQEDSDFMHVNSNVMSNDRLGATVIYDDRSVFYDVGVRLRASGYGRTGARAGFNIHFQPDHLFRGVQQTIVIDRGVVLSNGDSTGVRGVVGASPHELLFDQIANHAGGMPAMYNDVAFFDAPRTMNTGLGALKLARFSNDYLDSQFTHGSDGSIYKFELIYYPQGTVDGNPESLKTSPNAVNGIDIRNLGDTKDPYRLNFILGNNRDIDDFTRVIDLGQTFSLAGNELDQRSREVMDLDEWMRYVAMISLTGVGDTYLMDLNHNLQLYVRPEDNKVLVLPWDYDFAFFHRFDSPLTGRGVVNLTKIIKLPQNLRLLYGHMLDLINTSYNTAYLDPWIDNYTQRTDFADLAPFFHEYISKRAEYVRNQLAVVAPQMPFEITSHGGNDFSVDQDTVTLEGNGWIDVHAIRLAGSDVPLDVTWTDQDSWHVTLPLQFGPNRIELGAFNFQGDPVGTDVVTVTSSAGDPVHSYLRITELNYNPYDPLPQYGDAVVDNDRFEFIELSNTSASTPIDLAGVSFSAGVMFTFGDMTLPPDQRVLVVRNQHAFESRYGTGQTIAGEFVSGKLSNRGETIQLDDATGTPIVRFTYGDSDPWPGRADGKGATLEVIDTEGPYNDPANWRSSNEYGGSPGRAGTGPVFDAVVNEVLARSGSGQPDRVELVNVVHAPVDVSGWYASDDSRDLLKQILPSGLAVAAGSYLVLDEDDLGFTLDGRAGGDLWLIESDPVTGKPLRFADHVEFGAAEPGKSLGRWPNADPAAVPFPMKYPTMGATNSGPAMGPAVVSEVHFDPLEPQPFEENFNSGTAAGFVPVLGTWTVTGGRYEARPVARSDTIATIPDLDLPRSALRISATINIPAESDDLRNGAVVFDYRSPTDFKFAGLYGNGHWRIGQRDADEWNYLADIELPVAAEIDYRISVDIDGALVRLMAGSSERVRYDFGTPVDTGLVGLGSRRGEVRFDDVVIEPLDEGLSEFIEVFNTGSEAIDLGGWVLGGAVDCRLPADTIVGGRQTLVLVGFDPTVGGRAAAFRTRFGLDDSVPLVGSHANHLGQHRGLVQLMRPVTTGGLETGDILVDRVSYDTIAPWPPPPDHAQRSLQRVAPSAFGDFATSWVAEAPTPGATPFGPVGDLNRDGKADQDDIAGFVLGLADPEAYAAMFGMPANVHGDTDGDGDLDVDDIAGFVLLLRTDSQAASIPSRSAVQPTRIRARDTDIGRAFGPDSAPVASRRVIDRQPRRHLDERISAGGSRGEARRVHSVRPHRHRIRSTLRRPLNEAELASIWSAPAAWRGGYRCRPEPRTHGTP